MEAKKTSNVTVNVKSIEFDRNQQLVMVCAPNEHNPKGSYVMNAAQEQRLLQRVGIPNVLVLKHLVALANGTAKLSYVATFNKTGDAWDNGKEGAARKSGTFEKDWTNLSNHELDLGFIAKTKVAEVALQTMFSAGDFRTQSRPTITAPVAVTVDANDTTVSNDTASTSNTATTEEPNA